ncbi:MAG: alpha/beta hydrolase-fold protein [Bacteroides sp.]|nr:alpha/beta hydrolase-fold protein [Bacteroides sp.]MCM1413494.1 alpha/beta hydrolase-fold protein [Bacteroides sp.]MCM1471295.1 alpha/beta hydrolase-fold protein [Bacteroides sp.]
MNKLFMSGVAAVCVVVGCSRPTIKSGVVNPETSSTCLPALSYMMLGGGEPHIYQPAMGGEHRPAPTCELADLIKEVVPKFHQYEFYDSVAGDTIPFNLLVPENVDDGQEYPLVLFIADASTPGKDVLLPLTQGYGGLVWGTDEFQKEHPCFVVVPQYPYITVDDQWQTTPQVDGTVRLVEWLAKQYPVDSNRLYTTGQSMGGMMSLYFNVKYPGFFAASLFVACQWDISKMTHFDRLSFAYIAAGGDPGGSGGERQLQQLLTYQEAPFGHAEWSARLPETVQESLAAVLIAEGYQRNFILFEGNTVLSPQQAAEPIVPGEVHMASFDYAYRLAPVREWLFRQSK